MRIAGCRVGETPKPHLVSYRERLQIDGRLVAMAGQRMRMTGFSELSGLCTHPDFQRRGLGTLLFRFVAGEISARDEIVFLHRGRVCERQPASRFFSKPATPEAEAFVAGTLHW